MIRSKSDLQFYLDADRLALGFEDERPSLLFLNPWRFQRLMRRLEYFINCRRDALSRPYLKYLRLKYHYLGVMLGFYVPPNVCGPGLNIHHHGYLVINKHTRIGENCCLQQGVNIGRGYEADDTPVIGNNVYIGPGAKLFGRVTIADDIAIGANAVVNRSFTEKGITIAGMPARKISDKGSKGLVIRATEMLAQKTGQKRGLGPAAS